MTAAPSVTSLQTERLTLYPTCLEDLEARVAMDRDPRVMQYVRPITEDIETDRRKIRERILDLSGLPGPVWHVALSDRPGFWVGVV